MDDPVTTLAAFSRWMRFAAILGGISVGVGVWALTQLIFKGIDVWRQRFLEEAEMEIEEMLMQLPAAKVFNYSVLAATGGAVIAFFIMAPGRSGFNWQFGTIFGVAVFIAVMGLSRGFLRYLRNRRLHKFNDQLEEALMSMSNALKAGFSINQAIDMVIRQKRNPISLEFKLMMQQTQLGMSFDDAMRNMARRVQSEDFDLTASAISTARQTGGDLTGVFERLSQMIRERLRIQRRIRTLTAQGRMQGKLLSSLPVVLLGILYFFVDPELVRNFFTHPIGIILFIFVLLLEIGGYLTIRKIVNIDI